MVLLESRSMPLGSPIIAGGSDGAALELHRRLASFNRSRNAPDNEGTDWLGALQAEYRMRRLEHDFVEAASANLRHFAREAPLDPDRFVEWFEQLTTAESLFPELAERASAEQLRWVLRQSAAAEAGFEDLSALTQLQFVARVSDTDSNACACAKGLLLDRLGRTLAFAQPDGEIVWESLALSNLMVALAANRRYAYQSVGALAAFERRVRSRQAHLERGLERWGIQSEPPQLPAPVWTSEARRALVAKEPPAARWIAEGALLRIAAEARCFARYRNELQAMAPLDTVSTVVATYPPLAESARQSEWVMAS